MKLTIGDKTYGIYFKHEPNESKAIINEDDSELQIYGRTFCGIVELTSEGKIPVSEGYGYCSLKDQYNKETGRRVALKRALEDKFNYQERSYFWQFYLHRADANAAKRIEVSTTREKQKAATTT
jgi:hypothetical protein